jgi:hypothetical protein
LLSPDPVRRRRQGYEQTNGVSVEPADSDAGSYSMVGIVIVGLREYAHFIPKEVFAMAAPVERQPSGPDPLAHMPPRTRIYTCTNVRWNCLTLATFNPLGTFSLR